MTAGSNKSSSIKATIKLFFTKYANHYHKHESIYTPLLLSVIIACIGILLKIYQLHSVGMWDEGWYCSIVRTMADSGDWFLPLYYMDGESIFLGGGNSQSYHGYAIFDKPPMIFWFGAFLASIFDFTSFAAKLPMALSAGLLGVTGFFLYDVSKKVGTERAAGVFAGLLTAVSYFISVYGRTAYLDTVVIFYSALTVVLAMRAFDNAFEEKYRKGIFYAVLFGLVMTSSIFSKAWQSLIVGPPIALYIIFRFFNRYFEKEAVEEIFNGLKKMKITISSDYLSELVAIASGAVAFSLITLINEQARLFSLESLDLPLHLNILSLIGGLLTILVVKIFCDAFESGDSRTGGIYRLMGFSIVGLASLGGVFAATKIYDTVLAGFDSVSVSIFTGLGFPEIAGPVITALAVVVFTAVLVIAVFFASTISGALVLGDKRYISLALNALMLIPLGIAGGWLAYWFLYILLKGDHFGREPASTALSGVIVPLILIIVTVIVYSLVKQDITRQHVEKSSIWQNIGPYFTAKVDDYLKFFIFFCFVMILITLSFYPLNAWIWYIDANIEAIGYPIRVPGELWQSIGELPENGITLEYIYYNYYIGWRYTHGNKYDLFGSLHGLKDDPIFVIGIPFFLMGIYYFIKKREYSKILLFGSWLTIVLVTFLPSSFQLDYYYMAVFPPYYAIVAKGMAETLKSGTTASIRDFKEQLIMMAPFYAIVILPVMGTVLQLIETQDIPAFINGVINYFLQDYVLISLVLFTCAAFLVARTVPGMITLMIVIPYITNVIFVGRIGFRNTFLLIFTLGCFLLLLYRERKAIVELAKKQSELGRFKRVEKLITGFTGSKRLKKNHLVDLTLLTFFMAFAIFVLTYNPIDILIELVIVVVVLSAGVLFSLRRNYPVKSLVLVLLIIMTSAGSVAKLAYYNNNGNLSYDECASYILSHGGDFNGSTWVFDESGAKYAMRYVLGYEIIIQKGYQNPFLRFNITEDASSYNQSKVAFNEAISSTSAKFWVIITRKHWDTPPMTDFFVPWGWFASNAHMENVSEEAGIVSNSIVQLWVNATWIAEQGGSKNSCDRKIFW